jgi:opacity protein-like surface antigen
MVKYFSALLVVIAVVAFAAPAFAQDAPQFEITLGYGNLNLNPIDGRHSGFASHQTINLNHWFGIENYLGYYSFGRDPDLGKTQFLMIVPGAKLTYRASRIEPFAVVGLGGGSFRFPDLGQGTGQSLAFRIGGGVDIPFKENFAFKVDVSRVSTRPFGTWSSGMNISTGLVIKIYQ